MERLICEFQQHSAVVIAGNFNAHLGASGGPQGDGEPNQQGLFVKDLIDRCSLHVISLSPNIQLVQATHTAVLVEEQQLITL